MTLLDQLLAYLEARGVAAAVIGGVALAAHGIARATLDVDLLVVDRGVLESAFWAEWHGPEPERRRGDVDDPLAGVVRLSSSAEPVDIVVGRQPWQRDILARRIRLAVGAHGVWVVEAADLVLLKLDAGGPQDLLDVELLVAADPALVAVVEPRLASVPAAARAHWRAVLARRRP